MKKLLSILSILAILGFAGFASAVPQWTDVIDPQRDIYLSTEDFNIFNNSYTYTHDIKNDGFNPAEDLATSYYLEISLYDDLFDSRFFKTETIFIDQPGFIGDMFSFEATDLLLGYSFLGLSQINYNGELTVTVKALQGDFFFDSSKVTVQGVPEPATMILLGTGLIGLAGLRRKFIK